MTDASEILRKHGISSPSIVFGRHYAICPRCSKDRKGAHKTAKVLGITIDADGVSWGCNHCGWTGGEKYVPNGRGGDNLITYDYDDEGGALLFQKVRAPGKRFWLRRPDGNGGWSKS